MHSYLGLELVMISLCLLPSLFSKSMLLGNSHRSQFSLLVTLPSCLSIPNCIALTTTYPHTSIPSQFITEKNNNCSVFPLHPPTRWDTCIRGCTGSFPKSHFRFCFSGTALAPSVLD